MTRTRSARTNSPLGLPALPPVSVSTKLKIARPYKTARNIHKRVDEALQIFSLNGDIMATIIHHSQPIDKAHVAIDHLQQDVSIFTKVFLVLRLTRVIYEAASKSSNRKLNEVINVAPILTGVLLYIAVEEIFLS
jgi:hypothetical protein